MEVYIYCADMYCEECAGQIMLDNPVPEGADIEGGDESTWDSDDYPKGPYGNGGGEADSPQHCGSCGLFLENPLTEDGVAYVLEAIQDWIANKLGHGHIGAIATWQKFYAEQLQID